MQPFHIHQGDALPQYTIYLAMVSDIDRTDPDCWEVTTASGKGYSLDGDDLARFKEAMSL